MTEPSPPRVERITVAIADMTCGTCVTNIEQALAGVTGVGRTDIRVEEGVVTVEGTATPAMIVGAIEAAGYRAHVVPEAPEGDRRSG
jgi:Cu+-exporting ATPase